MENQIIVKLPVEIVEIANKVSVVKQAEVNTVLNQVFTGTDEWEKQVDLIEVKGIEDKMSIQLAEVARKNAKAARLSAEKIFDLKREEVQQRKQEYDLEDKLWLKAKQVMQIKFKAIEEKAEWKANFIKRYEAEQKELITQKRILQVAKYSEINRIEFENMSEKVFESFIGGLKSAHEAKLAEDKRLEVERIEKERLEAERIEAQRLENIRLKAEAERIAKELENERKENEEKIAKERAIAKAEAERIAKENARLQEELRIKQEVERKSEIDRKEAEFFAKRQAEIEAKAPFKNKLKNWVDGFVLPEFQSDDKSVIEIKQKFESFKLWALNEINK